MLNFYSVFLREFIIIKQDGLFYKKSKDVPFTGEVTGSVVVKECINLKEKNKCLNL